MKPIIFILAASTCLFAQASDDLDRFGKCYTQFSGEIVSRSHPLFIKVQAGTMTGLNACKELLSSAYIYNGTLSSTKKAEGKKILHTFNMLHNSFFSNLAKKGNDDKWLYDYNDRSYYLLMAMFSSNSDGTSNYPFRKIFSDPITYKGVRESESANTHLVDRIETPGTAIHNGVYPYSVCGNPGAWNQWGSATNCVNFPYTYQKIDPRMLEFDKIDVSSGIMVVTTPTDRVRDSGRLLDIGRYRFDGNDHHGLFTTHSWPWTLSEGVNLGQLIGLAPLVSKPLPHVQKRAFGSADGYYREYAGPAYEQPYPSPVENIYDNLGAGILFTPNFQESLGMDKEQIAVQNGLDRIPREWVQDVLKDFLCREIPVIRQADALAFTTTEVNARAPFRNAASCMRCHATTDALSFIARNYQYSRTSPLAEGNVWINQFHVPTKEPLGGLPLASDPYFPVRPADGHFRYRDYMGTFHNVSLTSTFNDPKRSFRLFGSYLSQMDDPYICLTSKYFHYLTGIKPVFFDPGEPDAPNLSERDRVVFNYVQTLGRDLKTNGDLKKVIMDIISSELFIDPSASTIKK